MKEILSVNSERTNGKKNAAVKKFDDLGRVKGGEPEAGQGCDELVPIFFFTKSSHGLPVSTP